MLKLYQFLPNANLRIFNAFFNVFAIYYSMNVKKNPFWFLNSTNHSLLSTGMVHFSGNNYVLLKIEFEYDF